MADISPEQVRTLLRAVETSREADQVARAARDNLDLALLQTAREARVGLRELSALTGMHHSTIRAGIQRAAGPSTIDFEQPELDFGVEPTTAVATTPNTARIDALTRRAEQGRTSARIDELASQEVQVAQTTTTHREPYTPAQRGPQL